MTAEQEQRTLDIAGIRFVIHPPSGLHLHEPDDACAPFLDAAGAGAPAVCAVPVDLCVGGMPDVRGFEKVFDAGETWTLYCGPKGARWIVLRHGDGIPLWAARMDRDPDHVTIFCGDRMIASRAGGDRLLNPLHYPLDQLLVMQTLGRDGGVIVHSAGAVVGGRGFVFAGRCGAGKTTLARNLAGMANTRVVSDDRCIVRGEAGRMRVYGTPWPGEARAALNESAPLAALLFLRQAERNAITPLEPREAVERLLPVCSIPWYDSALLPKVLDFCGTLAASVPCYVFEFTPGPEAGRFIADFAAGR